MDRTSWCLSLTNLNNVVISNSNGERGRRRPDKLFWAKKKLAPKLLQLDCFSRCIQCKSVSLWCSAIHLKITNEARNRMSNTTLCRGIAMPTRIVQKGLIFSRACLVTLSAERRRRLPTNSIFFFSFFFQAQLLFAAAAQVYKTFFNHIINQPDSFDVWRRSATFKRKKI